MNDGFCDICQKFAEHENLMTTFGIYFCPECRERFLKIKKADLIDLYKKACGYQPEQLSPLGDNT